MKKILVSNLLLASIISIGICAAYAVTLDDYKYEIVDLNYKKEYKAALEKANEAIQQYPNEAELYYERGQAYEELNSKQSAMANYNKAIQLNPKYDDAYFMRGVLKMDLNSPQSAYTDFTTCITINPKSGHCYMSRGAVRLMLGDINGSMSDIEKGNTLLDEEIKTYMKKLKIQLKNLKNFSIKQKKKPLKQKSHNNNNYLTSINLWTCGIRRTLG